MLFCCVLLYVACLYIRPGEVVPGLEDTHLVQILAGVTTLAAIGTSIVKPRRFWNHPMDKCVLGFVCVAVMSNAVWGWFGGMWIAAMRLAPPVFGYFLLRCGVRTPRQFRVLIVALVALTLFQAVNGIVEYQTGRGLGNVAAYDRFNAKEAVGDVRGEPPSDEATAADDDDGDVRRIRGTGIFNDPNDLAMTLIIAIPFVVIGVFRGRLVYRIAALGALGGLLTAVYYTNSRGGVLALVAMLMYGVWRRYGRIAALTVSVAAMALLIAAGPSRMSTLEVNEESAQGRIDSWSAGFSMLKQDPAFGVGFGQYTDYNELVAHNSLVHTLGELGLVGAFFFVGMFYWFFVSASGKADAFRDGDRWTAALKISGIGVVVCAFFLSRQYSDVLFLTLALGSTFAAVAGTVDLTTMGVRAHLARMLAVMLASVATMYVTMRVLLLMG